ncbi:uncharacterized protein LOC118406080 [Branchiostoma floridae]|uniref:Uncharacterized protein LOC118406080 n=1 Tax=Branchiostoma floridae TaxID=7739 RepID=A0A9J7HLT9_BRAFL|nr:uncharacterized protein LOC118406080 [Branchiostoma floridae]
MTGLGLVLVLSVLAVHTSFSQNVTDCSPCSCQPDPAGGTNVDCSGLGLTALPTNLPNDTVSLGFKYNNLTTLHLDELCKLRLLETVDLSKNKISSIRGSFRCFEYLEFHLSNNSLETLDRKTFGSSLTRLKQAFLFNNPWKCDCHLLWLKLDMQKYKNKFPPKEVRCQSPERLKGKLLKYVSPEDFTCPFPLWGKILIGVTCGLPLVGIGIVLAFRWKRKTEEKKRKPVFIKDGCVPTAKSLILEWTFAEGYNPRSCVIYITGGIVKTITVPNEQCMDGIWILEVTEGIACNTEYTVRVSGGSETDQGPSSDTICLVTVNPGVHVVGQHEEHTEYQRNFWIIGHEDDQSRIEKLCKALEKHHDLTGGTEYRDFAGGDSVFDNLDNAISTSKIVIVVLSNNTKGDWVKYQIQTVRHCLLGSDKEVDGSQRLIPIRLTCCRIPHCLRTLTTLDVWNKYFWRNLLAAFNKDTCNDDNSTAENIPLVQNNE